MAELSGQGPVALSQASSVATTDALVTLGLRARDASGNEYMYVSFGEVLSAGQWVVIANGVATRLATASRGPVGVVCTSVTSNDNGWVQIYGVYDTAQIAGAASSEATSIYVLGSPAGATTEAAAEATSLSSLATNRIFGAWPRAAASTATTASSSAHSGVTIQVQLNYPYVLGESLSDNSTVGTS